MAHNRLKRQRQSSGLFDVPGGRNEEGETGVLGGPADDSGLFDKPTPRRK
jgi:hypothetical protein